MLATYQDILKNYNATLPADLHFPTAHGATVTIGDATATCTLELDGEAVIRMVITADDDSIETGTFYAIWVAGFEGGMGWESMSYYRAMQATLADHGTHTGVNRLGIQAVHSWADGKVTMVVTRQ